MRPEILEPLFVLAFLLVPLAHALIGWLRRHAAQRAAAVPAPRAEPAPHAPSGVRGPRPPRVARRPVAVAATPDPGGQPRPRRRAVARVNAGEARRGVVLATVLGPCRGLDPGVPASRPPRAP